MKKPISILLVCALLAGLLLAGGCAGVNKSVNAYINEQTEAVLQAARAYLNGETDAKTAHAAIQAVSEDAAARRENGALKDVLQKNAVSDAAFTAFEARLQLLLSNFNHYLVMEASFEKGLIGEEELQKAAESQKTALQAAVESIEGR